MRQTIPNLWPEDIGICYGSFVLPWLVETWRARILAPSLPAAEQLRLLLRDIELLIPLVIEAEDYLREKAEAIGVRDKRGAAT